MEPNTLREEPVVIASQLDPLGDALDHLYPLSSMKNSKQSQPDDPLGENQSFNSNCYNFDVYCLEVYITNNIGPSWCPWETPLVSVNPIIL